MIGVPGCAGSSIVIGGTTATKAASLAWGVLPVTPEIDEAAVAKELMTAVASVLAPDTCASAVLIPEKNVVKSELAAVRPSFWSTASTLFIKGKDTAIPAIIEACFVSAVFAKDVAVDTALAIPDRIAPTGVSVVRDVRRDAIGVATLFLIAEPLPTAATSCASVMSVRCCSR